MSKPLFLRLNKNGEVIGVQQFQSDQVIFGREGESQVKLEGDQIAPIHAMIERREDGFYICDLGSQAGTFIGGQKVLDQRIESGTEITIGEYQIEFYEGIPKPKTKPPVVAAPPPPVQQDDIYDAPPATKPQKPTILPQPTPVQPKVQVVQEPKAKSVPQPIAQPTPAPKPTPIAKPTPAPTPAAKPQPKPAQAMQTSSQGAGMETYSSTKPIKTFRKKSTFAPPSIHKDLNERIKPEKGTTVEITVAWNERILSTYHYQSSKTVTVGSHPKNDIILPVFGSSQASHPLVKIEALAKVFITSDMRGVLVKGNKNIPFDLLVSTGAAAKSGAGYQVTVEQGEMVRVDFDAGVSIYIRYVSQAPKPLIGPFWDLNTGELTVLVLAVGFVSLMALFLTVYQPDEVEEKLEDESLKRKAVFVYKPPEPTIEPAPVEPPPTPKIVKPTEKPKPPQPKASSPQTEGLAKEAPKTNSNSQKQVPTAANPGTDKGLRVGGNQNKDQGQAAAGTPKKDVKQSGLLGAFARKGNQEVLQSAVDGSGKVGGAAEAATGSGSKAAAGSGVTPGGGLNEVGKGGQGESTYGISGVNTRGKGSGNTGYGTGSLGTKASVSIIPGGEEEAFEGGIDREAVRQVVMQNLRQLRACYERVTRVDPSVGGKVVFNWTIEAGGKVGIAKTATSEIDNQVMLNCMLSRLRSWRFPEPPEGLVGEVTFPFVFAATSQ